MYNIMSFSNLLYLCNMLWISLEVKSYSFNDNTSAKIYSLTLVSLKVGVVRVFVEILLMEEYKKAATIIRICVNLPDFDCIRNAYEHSVVHLQCPNSTKYLAP